jgi:hypothetical protein
VTVSELIELLDGFPADAVVVLAVDSDEATPLGYVEECRYVAVTEWTGGVYPIAASTADIEQEQIEVPGDAVPAVALWPAS